MEGGSYFDKVERGTCWCPNPRRKIGSGCTGHSENKRSLVFDKHRQHGIRVSNGM